MTRVCPLPFSWPFSSIPCRSPPLKIKTTARDNWKSSGVGLRVLRLPPGGQFHTGEQCLEPPVAVQIAKQGVRLEAEHCGMVLSICAIEPPEGIICLCAVGVNRGDSVGIAR